MFKDNKVLILGLARSGYQAAKLLIKRGNEVYLNEAKEEILLDKEQVSELRELGVNLIFGYHPDDLLDSSFDYLIKIVYNDKAYKSDGYTVAVFSGYNILCFTKQRYA